MMNVIALRRRDLHHLADQRGDQPGLLGDADADHRDEDHRDHAEVVEVLDDRGEHVADAVAAEQALDLDGLLVDLVVGHPAPAASWVIEGYVEPASVSVCDTAVATGSATSVVTLTPAHDRTADSTITPTIRPRKIIAGCGTLLPTRSIQPRKPPLPPAAGRLGLRRRLAHRVRSRPVPANAGRQLDQQLRAEPARALVAPGADGRLLRRAGDVDVGPRRAVDELLEEQRGGDRARR